MTSRSEFASRLPFEDPKLQEWIIGVHEAIHSGNPDKVLKCFHNLPYDRPVNRYEIEVYTRLAQNHKPGLDRKVNHHL